MPSPILKYFLLVFLFINPLLSSCNQQAKKKMVVIDAVVKDWNQTIPGNFSAQSKTVFDSTKIDSFLLTYPTFKTSTSEIRRFYKSRNYAYAWFDDGRLVEYAGNLANRILNLETEGIYSNTPYKKELDSLIYNVPTKSKQPNLELELMLTAQYFVFSKVAWQGMSSGASKSTGWYLPRKKVNYEQYLDSLLKSPEPVGSIREPVNRQYELLRGWLQKYRDLDIKEEWKPIAMPKKSYKLGDSAAVISLIKKRLYQLNDYKGDTLSTVFSDELLDAVELFQGRHGLEIDGVFAKKTLEQLNVPLENRIKQILVNMERSRWLPINLDRKYLAVNIPEFKLHVYNGESLLWSCKVVVGKTVHQTTVFYGEIKYVVFSPYWNVPNGILRKEIIPAMRKDQNYLAKHDMEITGYRDGLPIIRQKPGPENSLGLVKFLFPNSYNIYLHDTPSKSLFGESTRAFSHGCIRVNEPVKLANFLLKNQTEWDANRIDSAMHAGVESTVTLKEKVPVYIAYLTAFTDRNHQLNFRNDIYDLDKRLADMIISGKGKY
ncbi:murein L,D-transpeptidase YcbB/YkuD [Pedobacter sp. CG_S7]|uniref:L,D-transpeptidase family protein n=1 Tax=Pedobacter sp. CG_S7 TaxID=3143930 RepID=UPI003396F728